LQARGLAEHLGVILAVESDRHLGRIDEAGELDFEVELGAGEDIGAVDRIEGLGERGRRDQKGGNNGGGRSGISAHGVVLTRCDRS